MKQKFCHHNGKYTLDKDDKCCKCGLPLLPGIKGIRIPLNQREMTKIKIEAEFEIKDAWCAASPDKEEKDWFWNEVIPSSILILHSIEDGDNVSETKSFVIKKITFKTKER